MRNIELLEISPERELDLKKRLRKYSNNYALSIKINEVVHNEVFITIAQLQSDAKKTIDKDELTEIAHDIFDDCILPHHVLIIQTFVAESYPSREVNIEWVKRRMYQTSTKLKQMSKDFGLQKNGLDHYFDSEKPLNKLEKALFYYYLEYRSLLKEKGESI